LIPIIARGLQRYRGKFFAALFHANINVGGREIRIGRQAINIRSAAGGEPAGYTEELSFQSSRGFTTQASIPAR
jgi:hypothetical protein